ncbi:hypothetical protein Psfp_04198 [Pelotomaculum sp. FP]|uniref:hypothetical protein n=1 Tax=Pelotomaculum sp. FP TaxID=261474 RepID=UPI001064EF59|nr:hypothetical protein [Pelotomaculum sp. FP]TEB10202.1 hypothetical protein Psfp_04198 [Pelotomaculum sp. FP]
MFKRKIIIFLMLIMLITLCLPALASANVYVGGKWISSSGNITGIKADIYTAAYGVISSGHMTCAWPMVWQNNSIKYAQVGWAVEVKTNKPLCHYFYQAIDGTYAYEYNSSVGPAWNTWHNYSVIRNSDGYWVGKADDAIIGSVYINMNPNEVQYYNENDSSSTQYIGTSDNKLEFSQVKYYNGSSWLKPSLTFKHDTNSSIDTSYWSSGGYWYSWDSRY